MSDFRALNESELARKSSDELIAYIRAADAAGDGAAQVRALSILVFRHTDDMKRRVMIKVPELDVEDVTMEAVASAINSAFDGTAIGQFRAWLNQIVARRIVDYWRKREREPEIRPLPEEHAEAEEIWGTAAVVGDPTGEVDVRSVIERALEQLNEVHRKVIELYVFEDCDAKETADEINKMFGGHPDLKTAMTNDNVHKVKSRFSELVRELLEEEPGGPAAADDGTAPDASPG